MGTFFRKSLFITISVFSSNSFGYCIYFLSIFNLFLYKVRGTDLVYSSIFGYLLFLAPYAEGAFFSPLYVVAGITFRGTPSVTYFLQLGSTS